MSKIAIYPQTLELDNNALTQEIMNKVAIIAEKDLKKKIHYIIPVVTLLIIMVSIALHTAVDRLLDKGVVAVITDFEYGEDVLWPHIMQSINLIWAESEKTVLISLSVLVTSTAVIITKSNISSFPSRFKEIKKFKKH
jgi:hypothetical protein